MAKRASFSAKDLQDDSPVPSTLTPTDEQAEAISLFKKGNSLVVEALAGVGKTAVLKMMAESQPKRQGQFTAFNKAIVLDAASKMPISVNCSTAHSLAYKAVGWKYRTRMGGARIKLSEMATKLKIKGLSISTPYSEYEKVMESWKLAGHVSNAVSKFCQSGDKEIGTKHFPRIEGIDEPDDWTNHNLLAGALLPAAKALWSDLQGTKGWAKFDHPHYLKIWELGKPVIETDYILCDEAADLSPVMLSILEKQLGTQLIFVGDSCQAINEWTGAVDALKHVNIEARTYLTKSWRFGQGIADEANKVLEKLGSELRLTGNGKDSFVGRIPNPKAILSRTNAEAVAGVLQAPSTSHLIGGGAEIIRFCEAAEELRGGRKTSHPELACFDSWDELEAYIADDAGADLKLLVTLVKKFGGKTIARALQSMPDMDRAKVVYSTVHKAKGLQFDTVRLASDFNGSSQKCEWCDHPSYKHSKDGCEKCVSRDDCPYFKARGPSEAELRLLYVGLTRAINGVDPTLVEALNEP